MNDFSDRLKLVRKQLGINQEEFAALGGVKKGAQFNYENGSRFPDAQYLMALSAANIDVPFLLSGVPSVGNLSEDEIELLTGYKNLDVRGKAGVLGTISGMGLADAKVSAVVSGKANQVIQGNQTVNAPLKLNISTTKKKAGK